MFPRGWAYGKGYSNLAQSKELKGNFPVLGFFPHLMIAAIRRKQNVGACIRFRCKTIPPDFTRADSLLLFTQMYLLSQCSSQNGWKYVVNITTLCSLDLSRILTFGYSLVLRWVCLDMITFLNISRPEMYKLNLIVSVRNYSSTVMCMNNKSLTKWNRFA